MSSQTEQPNLAIESVVNPFGPQRVLRTFSENRGNPVNEPERGRSFFLFDFGLFLRLAYGRFSVPSRPGQRPPEPVGGFSFMKSRAGRRIILD
jgi:hypothetical protein